MTMIFTPTGELQAIAKACREACYSALAERKQVALTLDPIACLSFLDMLEGTAGYTRLVRDDAIDRLSAEVDRLHEQIMLLVACRDDDLTQTPHCGDSRRPK